MTHVFVYGLRVLAIFLGLSASAAAAAAAANVDCTQIPAKSIRWIVPNTVGSMYDSYSRTLAPGLESRLDRRLYVDNVSGAGGIMGVRELADAAPDGTTLGIVNGTGVLVAGLTGRKGVPDLIDDLQILGRASPTQHVWAVAADSDIVNLVDLRARAQIEPIVFAVRDVASTAFASMALGAAALQMPHIIVAGYASNRDSRLALLRGEVDAVSMDLTFGSRMLANGDLRAVLQLAEAPYDDRETLTGVATLTGPNGVTANADERSRDIAQALVDLLRTNRLLVAPEGLSRATSNCLQQAVAETLSDPDIVQTLEVSGPKIEFTDGPQATADLRKTVARLPLLAPIIDAAADRLR